MFFSKMGPLIGKNSLLRSRSLDSLTVCKFSSHSSEHRRRSYISYADRHAWHAKMIMCFHCPDGLLKSVMQYLAITILSHRSQRPTVHAFLQKDALELFISGSTLSDVHALGENGPKRFAHLCGRERFPRDCLIRSCWSFWIRHSFNCCLCRKAGNSMHQSRFREELLHGHAWPLRLV